MGTRLIQQRRGKGTLTYRSPSHRYLGKIKYVNFPPGRSIRGEVIELADCRGHDAPLIIVKYETGDVTLLPAPIGIKVGDTVWAGDFKEATKGSVCLLADLPLGVNIHNIENTPYSNGRFVRNCGGAAKIINKSEKEILLELPSKKRMALNPRCRATVGKIAGGGRKEKPFVKAGTKMKAMQARNKLYPRTSGVAMNAVCHPLGGTHRRGKGRPLTMARGTPPGRKIGLIAAKRTGRKKKN